MMKLIILFVFAIFISLSGCKNTSDNTSSEKSNFADTSSLALAKAEFKVNGMHCTGCENTIKTNVKEIKGVKTVEATFTDNKTIVSFDSTLTNEIAIMSAIEDAGYKVDTFMRR